MNSFFQEYETKAMEEQNGLGIPQTPGVAALRPSLVAHQRGSQCDFQFHAGKVWRQFYSQVSGIDQMIHDYKGIYCYFMIARVHAF